MPSRPLPALVKVRSDLHLSSDEQVRMVFEGDERVPLFECFPCETLLRWSEEKGWWECPSCTYELTPTEAEELVDLAIRRLQIILTDVRRKQGKDDGKWGEENWFFRILRRLFGGSKRSS